MLGPLRTAARLPGASIEFANILLTQDDARIGASARDVVWTYRTWTLYRYRSTQRVHPVPLVLVFALINRPDIFDLRPGNSFVEHLLDEGYDVYLLDWGVPDESDADLGIDDFALDGIGWGVREVVRDSGSDEVSLVGWCIGGALCLMHAGTEPRPAVRNLVLLTTPLDTSGSLYASWVGNDEFDPDRVAELYGSVPGPNIDWANKLMKPVTNYVSTYRRLFQQVLDGEADREAYQSMAKWVSDNPPFPGRAYREWLTWMYKENRLVQGTLRLRDQRVDLGSIDQNTLVVTAGSDHIAPREGTEPLLDLLGGEDVSHLARPGGHIGLMAGSKARKEIWPEICDWLEERSGA